MKESAADRFVGFSLKYDKYRPVPPNEILEVALKMVKKNHADLVVDLGSGTGLSTRPWTPKAENVIGIEPSLDMIQIARMFDQSPTVKYINAYAHNTGLPRDSADIVTASSSIHWMEPHSTLEEITRILKKEGALVIYGHYYPVYADSFELTKFHEEWRKNLDYLEYTVEKQNALKFKLSETLDYFDSTDYFSYSRKLFLHSKLEWSKEQVLGFMEAHAGMYFLRNLNYSDQDLLMDKANDMLASINGDSNLTVYFTYSVYIAIKR